VPHPNVVLFDVRVGKADVQIWDCGSSGRSTRFSLIVF
jgi:hypothetical protein